MTCLSNSVAFNTAVPRRRNGIACNLTTRLFTAATFAVFVGVQAVSQTGAAPTPAAETRESSAEQSTEQQVQRLTAAVAQAQAQIEANQKLLIELQKQLLTLQQQIAADKGAKPVAIPPGPTAAAPSSTAAPDEVREHQAIAESQIATHELTKVESQSKYPLSVGGLILFNAFVNTRQVDIASAPAYAIPGSGSTGLSLRQTVLGIDARGPHLLGATSHADVRVDFFPDDGESEYPPAGVLRLRTAHAELKWPDTRAYFALDRSILEPNSPSSLLAVGQPELAWAGNLWTWNPQVGVSHQFSLGATSHLEAEAALIDVADPHLPGVSNSSSVSQIERSRWPGSQARVAYLHGEKGVGAEIGVGGYFTPHTTGDNLHYDAWATAINLRIPVSRYFEITTNAYRGQALGGLGGGGYVDYVYQYSHKKEVARALEDVGGWAQLKIKASQRWEINSGYGIDNPFAKEITASQLPLTTSYPGLARNRADFSNVIYSPSKYLLFSLEYRRLWSNYATGSTHISDVIGIGAGYKF